MWDKLPSALRPSGRGVTENIIAGWIGTGIAALAAMIGASMLSWLAAPQSDQEWVKWFLGSLLVLSFAWLAFAAGWRKLYPLPTELARAVAAPAQPSLSLGDADWMTVITDLQPITHFLRDAQRRGWRFEDPKSQAIEFFGLLREAATSETVKFYGVRFGSGSTDEINGPRTKIDAAHWSDFRVDVIGCFDLNPNNGEVLRVKTDNAQTRTYKLTHETGYVDLHVVDSQATQWLREVQLPLKEAATRAYEQTRGSVASRLAEGSGPSPLTWYAYAIWQRVPIYGSFPPSRLIERIPDEEKNRFSFHIDTLDLVLKQYSGKARYVDLHVRGSELKQAIKSISELG